MQPYAPTTFSVVGAFQGHLDRNNQIYIYLTSSYNQTKCARQH